MSVWLPLMHTALMISGISEEAQMPRPNRLEVTPLHAQANRSQTKAQLASSGIADGAARIRGGIVYARESHARE